MPEKRKKKMPRKEKQTNKQTNKQTKNIIICLVAVAIVGLVTMLTRLLGGGNSNEVFVGIDRNADGTTTELQAAAEAKRILDHLDGMTSGRGFYGDAHHCRLTGGQWHCELETVDYDRNGVQEASFRQGLAVIWARYMYYHKTGDQSELAKMKKDLQTLHDAVVTSGEFVLQTDRYNCFLMADLWLDMTLDDTTRQQAKDICYTSDFENHPDSILVGYNRYLGRTIYRFADDLPDGLHWSSETPVVADFNRIVNAEDYELEMDGNDIIASINQMLEEIAADGEISNKTEISATQTAAFQKRELLAALDQIGKLLLLSEENAANNSLQEKDFIKTGLANTEYLLLTKETLQWYGTYGAANFDPDDNCLLYQNIAHYLNFTGQDTALAEALKTETTYPYCALAAVTLGEQPITDREKMAILDLMDTNNRAYGATRWTAGMMTADDEQNKELIWHVYPNAFLAGMLMKQDKFDNDKQKEKDDK